MLVLPYLKKQFSYVKRRLKENSFETIIWFIDVGPKMVGFSIRRKKMHALFWVVHLTLLVYIYCLGSIVYFLKYAEGVQETVKSCFNIAIISLIGNSAWWILKKRSLLKRALTKMEESDRLSRHSSFFQERYDKYIRRVKRVMFMFYTFNLSNAFFIYFPHRISLSNDYAMIKCVGMEPLTASPNGEICLVMVTLEEFSIGQVVINYQAIQLLLIEHTTIMFRLLALEMNKLDDNDAEVAKELAKEALPSLIHRHALLLDVVDMLKFLYSATIGINFGASALCILLFFYLPLSEWMQFIPVLFYCFIVFFMYCFLCQRLIDSSELFERAVYCCGWENFELKEQKLVYVMLRQSQKTVFLKAADIVPVNIATFASTLQFLFKFVTVVKI